MSEKILALWSTPRARSTAFMWMMIQRGDFTVEQEPFGRSAYCSEERIFDRLGDVKLNAEYNYQRVFQKLKLQGENERLFVKDFPYYFFHVVNEEFLNTFQHTFLIRNPAQALPSYHHKMPDLEYEECGYKELFELFQKVLTVTGKVPLILDAEDLVNSTKEAIHAYCSSVNIPFKPEALKWSPPKGSNKVGWWGDKSWNDDLRISRGFQATQQNYLKVHESEKLTFLYNLCMPYYEKLRKYCIRF